MKLVPHLKAKLGLSLLLSLGAIALTSPQALAKEEKMRGALQILQSSLPNCQVGSYIVEGNTSDFKSFTLTKAGGAEGCFKQTPVQLFNLPNLTTKDGSQPLTFQSLDGPPGKPIVGKVQRIGDSFHVGLVYPDPSTKPTLAVLSVNDVETVLDPQPGRAFTQLAGNPEDAVLERLPTLSPPFEGRINPKELVTNTRGEQFYGTGLYVLLEEDATLGEFNAALAGAGATVVASSPGSNVVGIAIQASETPEQQQLMLKRAEAALHASRGIALVARDRVAKSVAIHSPKQDKSIGRPPFKLFPIFLFFSKAADRYGIPSLPISSPRDLRLWLIDSFDQYDKGSYLGRPSVVLPTNRTKNAYHGPLVSGLIGTTVYEDPTVTGGTYPDHGAMINSLSVDRDFRAWHMLERMLLSPGRVIFNASQGTCNERKKTDSSCTKICQAARQGIVWTEMIRDANLERRTIISVSAGNDGRTAPNIQAPYNSMFAAAALQDNAAEYYKNNCQNKPNHCENMFPPSEQITQALRDPKIHLCGEKVPQSIPPLKNTLVAGNGNANTGKLDKKATPGGNVNIIAAANPVAPWFPGSLQCPTGNVFQLNTQLTCLGWGGSSSAAPQVAGAAAYVWNQNPTLSAPQVVQKIIKNQTKFKVLDQQTGALSCKTSDIKTVNILETLKPPQPGPTQTFASLQAPASGVGQVVQDFYGNFYVLNKLGPATDDQNQINQITPNDQIRIYQITPEGTSKVFYEPPAGWYPQTITMGSDGRLYLAGLLQDPGTDTHSYAIASIAPEKLPPGAAALTNRTGGAPPVSAPQRFGPSSPGSYISTLIQGYNGNFYVLEGEPGNQNIHEINSANLQPIKTFSLSSAIQAWNLVPARNCFFYLSGYDASAQAIGLYKADLTQPDTNINPTLVQRFNASQSQLPNANYAHFLEASDGYYFYSQPDQSIHRIELDPDGTVSALTQDFFDFPILVGLGNLIQARDGHLYMGIFGTTRLGKPPYALIRLGLRPYQK